MLKKSAAILLLVTITAPFWGTYIFLQHNRNKIKDEIAGMILAGLDKKDLVLLKFTEKETETKLNWKHAGEFEFNGQMFDIAKIRQDGDTVFYYCYKDDKETRLNKEKDLLLARSVGQDPCQKSQTDRLTDFFKSIYRQDVFSWIPVPSSNDIFNFSFLIFNYCSISLSPPAPPPK